MSSNPRLSMIAAIAKRDRAIGFRNALLWHIPEDFRHFKRLTTGHAIIMGENTFRSIGKALPKRTNIVLSQTPNFAPEEALVVRSIEEALTEARKIEQEEIFICGGASVYRQFLPLVERLYLTLVEGEYEADTYFPEYTEFSRVLSLEQHASDGYQFSFVTLEKK